MNYSKKFSDFKNLKVLVTGTTGFKGSWLAFWLNNLGAKVVGVALKPEKNSVLFQKLEIKKNIKQYILDISDFKKLKYVVKKEKPDLIIHLAAQSIVSLSYQDPITTFKSNIMGSVNILETFRLSQSKGLVFITSDKCYLNLDKKNSFKETDILGGIDNYSSSKASAENIFFSYYNSYFKSKSHISMVSARAGNVIGGGDFKANRIVPDIIRAVKKKKNLVLRNPDSTRPWQHVLEPLSGYLLLAHKILNKNLVKTNLPSWNFGPEKKNCKNVSFITKKIFDNLGYKKSIRVKKNKSFHESKLLSLNIDKAKKELKWKPILSLDETIKLTTDWYVNFYQNHDVKKMTYDHIDFYMNKSNK